MDHLESCTVGQAEALGITRHSDGTPHNWSGWPGAFCLDCRTEDPAEICLGDACECVCHAELWREYEEMMRADDGY